MGTYRGAPSVHSMKTVQEVLSTVGIREYTRNELADIGARFRESLLLGLEGKSELKMYPSYLDPVDPQTLPEGKTALVIEMGGSNVYSALVTKIRGQIVVVKYHRAPLTTRRFQSAEEFYNTVGELLQPVLEHAEPDALGVTYSWPGTNIKKSDGNDATISHLTKEFVIPEISKKSVGNAIREYLGHKYPYIPSLPLVAMNDTVAVLLSCAAPVGGVVATGINFAVATPKGIANTEAGAFLGIPDSHAFCEVDKSSEYPGVSPAEKHISGLYLPRYFPIALRALEREGYDILMPDSVSAVTMSKFLEREPVNTFEEIDSQVAKIIFTQSAQLVGQLVATAISTFHEEKKGMIKVPVEGSLFWGATQYAGIATQAANEALLASQGGTSDKFIHFGNVSHAGRIGAGIAALGLLRK